MFLGLLSLRALNEAKKGATADAVLKGSAILYGRTTCFASEKTVANISDRLTAGLSSTLTEELRRCFVSTAEIDPELKGFDSFDVAKKLQDLVETKESVDLGTAVEMANEVRGVGAIDTHEAASLYLSLHFNCPFHAHPSEAPRLQRLLTSEASNMSTEQAPLRFSLPNLDTLSWADIAELRRSRYLEKYRLFVANFHLKPDAEIRVAEEINAALWKTIGMQAPTASGSAFKRLIGQIPLPFGIPNPYSVYRDVKDGWNESMLFRKYGWLWFVQEAKSLSSKSD